MNRLEGNYHHPSLINLSNHWGRIGDYLRLEDLKTMMRPDGKVDRLQPSNPQLANLVGLSIAG